MVPAAFAADPPKKSRKTAPPPPAETYYSPERAPIWSGFYAGGSLGYAWGTSTQFYDRAGDHGTASTNPSGFLVAATAGYNMMWTPSVLVGVEADLGVMNVSAADKTVFDGHVYRTSWGPWWGTARARLGYVAGNVMGYVTGGVAFMAADEISIGNTPGETATNAAWRTGWVAGAGVEYALSAGMTAKLEYLHMDFGTYDGLSPNRENYSFKNTADIVRTGINFKF